MNYQISITQKCNLNCTYCYEKNKNYHEYMDHERIQQVCDFILNDYIRRKEKDHYLGINITGGEPLLHLDSVKFILSYFDEQEKIHEGLNVHFEISTNGTLFNDNVIELLNKRNVSLFIGIDGMAKSQNLSRKTVTSKGTFDIVKFKINKIVNLDAINFENIILNMVVTPQNVKYMFKNYRFLYDLSKGKEISINPALEEQWNLKEIKKYQKELRKVNKKYYKILEKKQGDFAFLLTDKQANIILADNQNVFSMTDCGACRDSLTITTRGEIIPCGGFLYAYKDVGCLKIGTIEKPIDETKINDFRDCIRFELSTCKDCQFLHKCVYFCPANNFKTTGDMNKTSFAICEINKATIIETERFLNYFYKHNKQLLVQKYRNLE